MIQNLNLMLPDWAKKDDKGVICLKSPLELYLAEKNEKKVDFTHFKLECSGKCGSKMHFDYHGFDNFLSENSEVDKSIIIFPEYTETAKVEGYSSISVDITNKEGIPSLLDFIANVLDATTDKIELVKDIRYKLQFKRDTLKVNLAIKEDGTVLLYKISEALANVVPDLAKPNSIPELLGSVYHFDGDINLEKIKEGYAPSNESTLQVLFHWVEKLLELNEQETLVGKISLYVVKY